MNPFTIIAGLFVGSKVVEFIKSLQKKDYVSTGVTISAEEVRAILKTNCLANAVIRLSDSEYTFYREVDMRDFVNKDTTDSIPYVINKWDCENYAWLRYCMFELKMPGCPIGTAEAFTPTGKHAFNIGITPDKKFLLQESQNKAWFPKPYDYSIDFAYI